MITKSDLYNIRTSLSLHKGKRRGAYQQIAEDQDCSEYMVRSVLIGERQVRSRLSKRILEQAIQMGDRLKRTKIKKIEL